MPRPSNTHAQAEESIAISAMETKVLLAQKVIQRMREELSCLESLLTSTSGSDDLDSLIRRVDHGDESAYGPANDGKIVEGVFDGQNMVGSDGQPYVIPSNYASKSKLVEGDMLKLTIQVNGTFLYKQIGPIERQRIVGVLMHDELTNDWHVVVMHKKYSVLPAAVSYYKGSPGDDAIILIPKSAPSKWAALENIIKKN